MKNPTQKQEPAPKAQRWERVWELEEPVLIPYGACKIRLWGWKELRAERGGGVRLERRWRFHWRSVGSWLVLQAEKVPLEILKRMIGLEKAWKICKKRDL